MLHRIVAALAAAVVLGLPGIAAAQSAPAAAPTPGAREMFGVVDVGVTSKVLNELSNGNGATSVSLRAAAELPALGHTFMGTLDYMSYSYPHAANNAFPAGAVVNCPFQTDAGCVTPVGYKLYQNVAPGFAVYVPAFRATDSETRLGIGSKITRDNTRLYITADYLWRTFNYGTAPPMAGFGIGLEKLPDFDRTLSFYGQFSAYADMHGSMTGVVSPALGALSGIPLNVDYRLYTYRVGATYSFANSPLFADLNVAGSRLDDRSKNASSDAVHAALSLGVGAHF